MAEIPVNGSGTDGDLKLDITNVTNWAGAFVSLALVVGAGVWGYQLLSRDVSGVPVVRAIEGPMREQPADPGGAQADHQGLAVNNVAAEGTAEGPADRLVLAPPPIRLTEGDAPLEALTVAASPLSEDALAESSGGTESIRAEDLAALVDQISAGAEPLATVPPAAETTAPKPAAAPLVTEGLGRSLRPKLRPAGLKEATLAAATQTPAAQVTEEVNVSEIAPGTRLVQLGAFASEAIARAEWDKLQAGFGGYLGDKKRVIQKASSGGRTFYRLRAMGFADLSDARRLCSALKAGNADCIPVVTR